jgi:hypothetical protein
VSTEVSFVGEGFSAPPTTPEVVMTSTVETAIDIRPLHVDVAEDAPADHRGFRSLRRKRGSLRTERSES